MTAQPLVVYCAFGTNYAQMLQVSLWSLFDIGEYEGDVLVITDLSQERLASNDVCPISIFHRVQVLQVKNLTRNGMRLMRYTLHRFFDLSKYGPILYLDCDIVFDKPVVNSMLHVTACSKQLCFPTEPESDIGGDSMAGLLLKSEGIEPPSYPGFNSGTMGIPHGADFSYFIAMERIASNAIWFWENCEHLFTSWFDQPVANYLHVKHDLYNTEALTPFFRFFFPHNGSVATGKEHRLGAGHFFADDKVARMITYLKDVMPGKHYVMRSITVNAPVEIIARQA